MGELSGISPEEFLEKSAIVSSQVDKINIVLAGMMESGDIDSRFSILIDTMLTITKLYISIYIKGLDEEQRKIYLEMASKVFLQERDVGY